MSDNIWNQDVSGEGLKPDYKVEEPTSGIRPHPTEPMVYVPKSHYDSLQERADLLRGLIEKMDSVKESSESFESFLKYVRKRIDTY